MNKKINVPDATEAAAAPAGTQSLQRAMWLLKALLAYPRRGASPAQLAASTGLDRSTAHRMLQCLAAEGLLDYEPQQRRYFFGRLAYEMGFAASERVDLAQLCKPTLARIAEDTGDTVFLMVRSGSDVVCADRAEGAYPIKTFVVDVGTRRPLGIGGGGVAILSQLPEEAGELMLEHNAARIATYPEMGVAEVRAHLARARRKGYVAMDVVAVPGVRTVSVAVVSGAGRPVAALSVSSIASRMQPTRVQDLVRLLQREAAQLSQMLAARFSPDPHDALASP